MRLCTVAVLAVSAATAAIAAESTPSCRASWNVVGACYTLHGKLSLASRKPLPARMPRARIASTDGKRVVGVLGLSYTAEGPGVLPRQLVKMLQPDPMETEIEGDFTLCPLDRDTEHSPIRFVCIQDATHLAARKRK